MKFSNSSHRDNQNLISNFERINKDTYVDFHISAFISNNHNDYSKAIQTYTMKNILFDKDDYTQIEKKESNPVKTILNRQGEINNESKEIKKKLEKILQMSTLTTMMNHTISLLHQSLDKDNSK